MIRSKTDTIQDTIDLLFSEASGRSRQPSIQGLGAGIGFRPKSTRFEVRADETTRLVREITDAETEQRQAKTAALRTARLRKEAEDRATVALAPAKKKATLSRKKAGHVEPSQGGEARVVGEVVQTASPSPAV